MKKGEYQSTHLRDNANEKSGKSNYLEKTKSFEALA